MQTSCLRGREAPLVEGVMGAAIIRGRQGELLRSSHKMAVVVAATMVVAKAKTKATPRRAMQVPQSMLVSHPVLEGKPNVNHVRARIRTHVHNAYIIGHHHTIAQNK
jgi:hypothetical protein